MLLITRENLSADNPNYAEKDMIVMKPFVKATIEISGLCNAKCTWCTTGIKNLSGCKTVPEYMTADSFEKGLCYMLENGIIDNKTEIELYNWGEPFLNKNINDIAGIITKYDMKYHLSTNASVYRDISVQNLKNLTGFRVSLSGFSEETYAITHALDFSHIMENIIRFRDMLKRAGKENVIEIGFLTYKFNCHEIDNARDYFSGLGIRMLTNAAYYADYDDFLQFAAGTMLEERKALSRKHIFESLWKQRINAAPNNYECPQDNFIILSHKWQVVPCCFLTDKDALGDLFHMSLEDVRAAKGRTEKCIDCKREKLHFAIHNHGLFRYTNDPPLKNSTAKIYFDTGGGFNEKQTVRRSFVSGGHNRIWLSPERGDVKSIRFDPCDCPCIIKNIKFYADGKAIDCIKHNGKELSGSDLLIFEHSDPWFYPDVKGKNLDKIYAEYDIVCCTKEIISDLAARIYGGGV